MVDNATAVKTRFPSRAQAIDALLARDEGFRTTALLWRQRRVTETSP